MEYISAYSCEFCNKIYSKKSTCKAHEQKCFFNPNTKSCASCDFLYLSHDRTDKLGHNIVIQKCYRGIDISHKKLKTACQEYSEKEQE
jgi:hypothetical protein